MSSRTVHSVNAKQGSVYLSHNDLLIAYNWVGITLGFDYDIGATKLEAALQALLRALPVMEGRLEQTPEGRCFINVGGKGRPTGVSYTVARKQHLKMTDLPGLYVHSRVSESVPSNSLVPDLIPQMLPHLFLAGKEPLFKLQLSHLSDGSVLGISFAHVLADLTSMASALVDLCLAYQGRSLTDRPIHRLRMIRAECKAAGNKANDKMSDEEVLTALPCLEAFPKDFAGCVATQAYSIAGSSPEEREAGASHSAQVLHIPGATLKKLQDQVLASQIAVQGNITLLSKNDITGAILWIMREASEGNTLAGGLQKCLTSAVELRSNYELIDNCFFGNAILPRVMQPPAISPMSPAILSSAESAVQATAQTDSERAKAKLSLDVQYAELVAGAACASRQCLDALRADPAGRNGNLHQIVASAQPGAVKAVVASTDFHPFRDCALAVSSWRNLGLERVDFGHGKAKMILGNVAPAVHRFALVLEGPGGDGVFCMVRFPGDGFEKLRKSGVLAEIAPGAVFCPSPQG